MLKHVDLEEVEGDLMMIPDMVALGPGDNTGDGGGSRPPTYETWTVTEPGFVCGCRIDTATEVWIVLCVVVFPVFS